LYAKARQGIIKGFTGIDDPYEEPLSPSITISTTECSIKQAVQQILLVLEQEGFLGPEVPDFQQ